MEKQQKIIKIKSLKKSYGELKAVDNISFDVEKGELFAFLGINGAGKSTTINIICGQLSKDGGTVEIDGFDLDKSGVEIRKKLGVVFQNSVLDKPLSALNNLKSRGALYGMGKTELEARIKELSEMLEFSDFLNRPLDKLSGGQKRRIDIARALIHRPQILILDEPTTGLDPQTRKNLWSVIRHLREKENMTVFLTTHYMEEAAEADHIVILNKGKIVASGTPLELKNQFTGDFITIYGCDEKDVMSLGVKYEAVRDGFRLSVKNTAEATALITKHPDLFLDYEVTKGKMDDVFLAATGEKLKGDEGND
jgi:multidrug/hemolysin transport system ATP-binding protein